MYMFMNSYQTDITKVNGVIFYMIEMMQYLQDTYHIDVIEYAVNNLDTRSKVYNRYDYVFNTVSVINPPVNKFFTSVNALIDILRDVKLVQDIVNNVDNIYILNAAGVYALFLMHVKTDLLLLKQYNKLKHKLHILSEPNFENEFTRHMNLPIVPIVRGLYFKHFVNNLDCIYKDYFLYTIKHGSTVISHSDNDVDLIKQYALEQNITYSEQYSVNPALEYSGLLYFRVKDYMPRLPYEFWYYKKDVILFNISDGLQKRMNQYDTNIFDWYIPI